MESTAIIHFLKSTVPFSFVVPMISLIAICCHSCHSLYYSLSFFEPCCTTRCHSLSLVVPLVVIRCHLLYHSLSLVVTLVCLFINDHARMYNSFISQEKERNNNHESVRKTYYWKFIFVICSYSTYACRNLGTKSTQGTFAREHVSTQRTWTRKVRNLADSRTGWVDAMKWFLCRLAEHRIKLTIPNLFLLLKMFIELIFQIRCFSLILLFRVC